MAMLSISAILCITGYPHPICFRPQEITPGEPTRGPNDAPKVKSHSKLPHHTAHQQR